MAKSMIEAAAQLYELVSRLGCQGAAASIRKVRDAGSYTALHDVYHGRAVDNIRGEGHPFQAEAGGHEGRGTGRGQARLVLSTLNSKP